MRVCDLMTQGVATCAVTDDLAEPARVMWEKDCGCVPVLDAARRVVGMLTDRDVCMAAYTQGKPLREIRVSSAMSKALHACHPDDMLEEAVETMRREQVRRLPVVDETGLLVGLVSLNDLACEAFDERVLRSKDVTLDQIGETLAALCSHRMRAGEELVAASPTRRTAAERVAVPT